MNCKPGDLARILDAECTRSVGAVDKFVVIAGPLLPLLGSPGWYFEKPLDLPTCILEGIADQLLRPIRDQTGQDETLQWAPVPGQKVEVPA